MLQQNRRSGTKDKQMCLSILHDKDTHKCHADTCVTLKVQQATFLHSFTILIRYSFLHLLIAK